MSMRDLFDTWPERGGLVGSTLTAARVGVWLWRRRTGKTTTTPFFGWLARRSATEALLAVTTIRLRTAQAVIERLEAEIEAAGLRDSTSGASGAGSIDLPESTLVRSRASTSGPSTTTSGKPDSDPA